MCSVSRSNVWSTYAIREEFPVEMIALKEKKKEDWFKFEGASTYEYAQAEAKIAQRQSPPM